MSEAKVGCRTPTERRDGVTNIPKWKFDLARSAILEALDAGDVRFSGLKDEVRKRLPPEVRDDLGSLGWYTTCVKLELECRGEVVRRSIRGPQVIGLPES